MRLTFLESLLGSNWVFGFTQTGARRRRLLLIFTGASLWALFAVRYNVLPWSPGTSQEFVSYLLRALFNLSVFPIILVLSVFFGLVLFLAPKYLPDANPRTFRQLARAAAILLGIFWAALAYRQTEPQFDPNLPALFLAYPFHALFAAHILRHVLVVALSFWIAFRITAFYLDDIFELNNLSIAERYILQATFGSDYNTIVIKDGSYPPQLRDSPIVRIGGPGWVRVHLENAALFETTNGESRIIGPTGERKNVTVSLAAFERLRDVIDLRDQIKDLSLEGRTSDGIRVRAEDVHIVFSVYRGNQPSSLDQPYPYDEEALRRLYYSTERGDVVEVAMESLIRRELAKFISQHSLSEFLASASSTEQVNMQLPTDGRDEVLDGAQRNGQASGFITRPQMITELFAAQFAKIARSTGVELKWIGVGTWVTPDEIIPQRHREAWKLSLENLIRGSDRELARVSRDSEVQEYLRLVQETPLLTFRRNQELPSKERMRRIIIAYHGRLNEVYDMLQGEGPVSEERELLRRVLVFLSRFTTRQPRGPSLSLPPAGGIQPPPAPAGTLPPGAGRPESTSE